MTVVYVAVWLAFGLLLSVIVQRAATAALIGFGAWLGIAMFGRFLLNLLLGAIAPITNSTAVDQALGLYQLHAFVLRLLPTTLYSEASSVLLNPLADGDLHPGHAGPADPGAAADPHPPLARPEPAPGLAARRGAGRADGHLLRDRLHPVHAPRGARLATALAARVPSPPFAGVAESADAPDSKSGERKLVWVRLPPPAPRLAPTRTQKDGVEANLHPVLQGAPSRRPTACGGPRPSRWRRRATQGTSPTACRR